MTRASKFSGGFFLVGWISFLFILFPGELLSAPGGPVERGKRIFTGKCSACHTIGGGTRLGPDLKGITELRSKDWLIRFIADPGKILQAGDPMAKNLLQKFGGLEMPNLGLSGKEVTDVLSYLESEKPAASAPRVKKNLGGAVTGTPAAGERLFIGGISFRKNGPPCFSCHDISGIPFPGGGTLGPDLTGIYSKFGEREMNSILATLPFPTMAPVFNDRPLTLAEQKNLEAFFQKTPAQPRENMTGKIGLLAIGAFVILILLLGVIWRNRLRTVRKALLASAEKAGGTGK